jgi:hypothetical protein
MRRGFRIKDVCYIGGGGRLFIVIIMKASIRELLLEASGGCVELHIGWGVVSLLYGIEDARLLGSATLAGWDGVALYRRIEFYAGRDIQSSGG